MEKKIQLYLVSGFLGSGKTTFLQNLLTQSSGIRMGVIVNEFGSIGIDGKVLEQDDLKLVEINNGSIFCACLKDGFVKTLVAFLEQPIDVLVVEASGMADPSGMEHLLEQMDFLASKKGKTNRRYDYRGTICLVDAARFLELYEIFTPTQNQVKKSMFHVINKTDEVSAETLHQLHETLHQLNPKAFLYDTTYGQVPLSLIETMVTPESDVGESCNTSWNRPETCVLDLQDAYSLDSMKQFCTEIAAVVLRCKGFFVTPDGGVIHVDNVGNDIVMTEETRMTKPTDKMKKLVLIGKDASPYQDAVQNAWQNAFGDTVALCYYED